MPKINLKKSVKCLLLSGAMLGFMQFGAQTVFAQSNVRYMNNFAGVPISCSIEEGQAVISGIHSGYTISQVRAILGNPSYTSSAQSGQILTYSYFASGINVKFWNLGRSGQYTVCGIQTTKMGYYTPAGITVGMPADMLIRNTEQQILFIQRSLLRLNCQLISRRNTIASVKLFILTT